MKGIVYFILIVIGGVFLLSLSHNGAAPARAGDSTDMSTAVSAPNLALSENQLTPTPLVSNDVTVPENSAKVSQTAPPAQVPDQTTLSDQHPAPVMRAPGPRDEFAVAINEATPRALDSGAPEPWHAAGSNGFVVPSALQAYGDRTCRNIFSTIFYGDRQTQSSPVQWCREGDGEWYLSN